MHYTTDDVRPGRTTQDYDRDAQAMLLIADIGDLLAEHALELSAAFSSRVMPDPFIADDYRLSLALSLLHLSRKIAHDPVYPRLELAIAQTFYPRTFLEAVMECIDERAHELAADRAAATASAWQHHLPAARDHLTALLVDFVTLRRPQPHQYTDVHAASHFGLDYTIRQED